MCNKTQMEKHQAYIFLYFKEDNMNRLLHE